MPYKVILTHLDGSPESAARVDIACQIAKQQEAHLIGLAPISLVGAQDIAATQLRHQTDQAIGQDVIRFEQQCEQWKTRGLKSFESRRVSNTPLEALLWHARFTDLSVIGRTCVSKPGASPDDSVAEQLLLRSSRPLLIVPAKNMAAAQTPGQHVVIAWDGSQAAAAAVGAAIPLLQSANEVVVVVVHNPGIDGADELVAGTELRLYLARHGVTASIRPLEATDSIGQTLLEFIEQTHPDILVMGGYGHSRLRERLLGGTTRSILSKMSIPVLMTH